MNVPMSEEMRAKLISETDSMKTDAEQTNSKIMGIITASRADSITISGLGFELKVHKAIPGPVKRQFAKFHKLAKDPNADIVELSEMEMDIEAEFLAEMCVDPDLKHKELWIEFENKTGLLRDLTEAIINETCASEQQMKHFRRVS